MGLDKEMAMLCDKYSSVDILNALFKASGMRASKTQMRYAEECDKTNELSQEIVCEWREKGLDVFTADDLPDYVKAGIERDSGMTPNEMVLDMLNTIWPSATVRKEFVIVKLIAYFTLEGYRYLAAYSNTRFLTREELIKWIMESGYFNEE